MAVRDTVGGTWLHGGVAVVTEQRMARAGADQRAPLPRYALVRRGGSIQVPPALDEAQLAVVAHRSGPLLVIGGPGTGKTTTLVEAVAARVAEGVEPGRILVFTFGRRAAGALRNRLEVRLGRHDGSARATTMSEPVVRTFPAYAFGLLRHAAAEADEPTPRLLTGPEQDAVIRDLLADPDAERRIRWPDSLRHAVRTRAFAGELRDLMLRAAERSVGPGNLSRLGLEQRRPDWVAAARFMHEYQQVLHLRDASTRGGAAYDQAELVRAAATLLVDEPALHRRELELYRHVYVDELADTDPAQIDLLGLVASGGIPVLGFADPDSSTFAFRGADPTGVRDFTDRFRTADGGEAPRIVLSTGHRSAPALLAATRRVAQRLRGPARHRAVTPAADLGPGPTGPHSDGSAPRPALPVLEVCTLRSVTGESAYVAHRLREAHLHHGLPWSSMAVIVRSLQHHHAALRRALTQAGVPTTTGAEDVALATQPAVVPILLLLRCALTPSTLDEEAAVALLHSPLGGADPFSERQLRQGLRSIALAGGDKRPSGELLVDALQDARDLAVLDHRWTRPAKAVASLLATAREAAARPAATAEDVLWAVWRASGLADKWAAASARGGRRGATADRDLDAVMVLFDAAARFTDRLPGARVEAFLDHLTDQQLPADTLAPTADRGEAVRILTAHAAKGLEWDLVVVAGVQEGVWPDLRLRGTVLGSERLVDVAAGREGGAASQVSALLDEERRLFYVATTRARRSLLVTAVDASSSGSGGDEQPSRFLSELAGGAEDLAPTDPDAIDRFGDSTGEAGPGGEDEVGVQAIFRLPRPLTLASLVAELRTVAADPARSPGLRGAAATELARLAAADVPGADPDEWWGLPPISDSRPMIDPDGVVRVSPSTVEGVLRCGLRWLLERHGGSEPATAKQGIGNLVHDAATRAAIAGTTAEELRQHVLTHFDKIEMPAVWLGQRERERATAMVDKLVAWLVANPRRLVDVERAFRSELTPATESGNRVELNGRVDRLEQDDQGRLVVIDLKTGGSAPSARDAAEHAQLAAYQVAVEAGAFPEGTVAGGAEIVALGTASGDAVVREQPPLAQADDPHWAESLVLRAASAMAASTVSAVVNDSCGYCAVRTSCPVSGKGRQVTDE